MQALNDRQIARMQFRLDLFRRRGVPEAQAEKLVDRLVIRDAEKDDRHLCIECQHLDDDNDCFAARLLKVARERHPNRPARRHATEPIQQPMRTVLQRCSAFAFVTP